MIQHTCSTPLPWQQAVLSKSQTAASMEANQLIPVSTNAKQEVATRNHSKYRRKPITIIIIACHHQTNWKSKIIAWRWNRHYPWRSLRSVVTATRLENWPSIVNVTKLTTVAESARRPISASMKRNAKASRLLKSGTNHANQIKMHD